MNEYNLFVRTERKNDGSVRADVFYKGLQVGGYTDGCGYEYIAVPKAVLDAAWGFSDVLLLGVDNVEKTGGHNVKKEGYNLVVRTERREDGSYNAEVFYNERRIGWDLGESPPDESRAVAKALSDSACGLREALKKEGRE